MIPATIHQCWFGPNPIPANHRKWMDGIRAAMPDFQYRLWTDADLPDNRFVRECLAWKKYALLSDWMRLRILCREGGFYMDTDVEVFRSFRPLLAHACVLGFSQCVLERKPVSNAIMGAEPDHPFMRESLDWFVHGLNRYPKPPYGVKTGNQVLFRRGLSACGPQRLGDILLLDKDVLYGEFAVHHFEGSWHSRKDLASQWRSLAYRTSRLLVLAAGLFAGRRMYPGND